MPVKTVLFLVGGLIENDQGTSTLERSGAVASRRPVLAVLFAIPALSLAGIPPFSGFVAKLAVIAAAIAETSTVIVVAALLAGALTLLSMAKIWLGVFWGISAKERNPVAVDRRNQKTMLGATGLAVCGTLVISLLAGPLFDLCTRAAEDLKNPASYVSEVLS